ncbi:IS3 family transposase [Sphingobacterium zhuxiongii]|uniref:IS3 family transposase n=1 Tax=Sphingobacterium zhuxiongii TaxID=2662364 RepID=A0A5Q0Q7Z4_9SPHI|nr:IS3 family transposase [Sphingobacterium sp. dk4302]QGA25486.1 IS3 family transposase [Sphingobacterium sp. dk4302]
MRKYEFIKSHMNLFAVEKMCKIINTSRSSFYKWISRPKSNRDKRTEELSILVKQAHQDSDQIYGSPRITLELNKKNHKISRSYVARLMRKLNLRSKIRKKFKITTDSNHSFQLAENLLGRNFFTDGLSQKWVGDITYIKTGSGWLYLTTVIDLADRKIIGWSFSNDMTAEHTTLKALKMAIAQRNVKQGLIFHSDRGAQYACNEFKSFLGKNEIIQSMSRKGNCWDNAVAESFFKTLKCELVYHRKFANREAARLEIFRYIEGFYHQKRIHSGLGNKTPNEMEKFYKSTSLLVA